MADDVADGQHGGVLGPLGDEVEVAADLLLRREEGGGKLQAGALGQLGRGQRIADRAEVLQLVLGGLELLPQRREVPFANPGLPAHARGEPRLAHLTLMVGRLGLCPLPFVLALVRSWGHPAQCTPLVDAERARSIFSDGAPPVHSRIGVSMGAIVAGCTLVTGRLTRREALGAGAVAAAAGTVPAQGARRRRAPTYDVVVVGAGLAGLSAARDLRAAGRRVVVLEARRRVGGRNLDLPVAGGVIEMGGQWTGPGQDRVMGLAKELGIATFGTYASGQNVYVYGGTRRLYSGDIPPAGPVALVQAELAITALNQMAAGVPAEAPWTAARAAEYDRQSVAGWAAGIASDAEARSLIVAAVSGVYGEDPSLISLLDLLRTITGVGGDFNTLVGSAQSIRFVGGPQQLSKRLARALGRSVRLGMPVVAVRWDAPLVRVTTPGGEVRARRVILTPPGPVLARIAFHPALPAVTDQALQHQPQGSVTKVNAVYAEPFWRADGLSGSAVSDAGPVRIVYDNSPPGGRPGVLVGFMEGNDSRSQYGRTAGDRRTAALASLAVCFGDRAKAPIAYHDLRWDDEVYTRGAYGTYSPPGVLTALRDAGSGTIGPLHLAGADRSSTWPGYMDGAIGSGRDAAARVLADL